MSAQDVVSRVTRNSDGILFFICPGCRTRHHVVVHPDAWNWNGSYDRPTFSPSILVRGVQDIAFRVPSGNEKQGAPYVCHSFVADGQIQFLTDCTHALAGQTVPLMPVAP